MIPKVSCNLDSVIFWGESFTHMIKKWKAEPPFLPACISHKLFIFFFFFWVFFSLTRGLWGFSRLGVNNPLNGQPLSLPQLGGGVLIGGLISDFRQLNGSF